MPEFNFSNLENILQIRKIHIQKENERVKHIYTDSRKIVISENAMFIALHGPNHDGHLYIQDCIKKGVKNFVIDDESFVKYIQQGNYVLVDDTLRALQSIAAYHRRQLNANFVAITGSNGKTITKEWLFNLLASTYKTYRSPKSYNSQVGVALSLLLADPGFDYYLIEAGISQPGEMKYLSEMICPDEVIFTHLGEAHLHNFRDRLHLLLEKSVLFTHAQKIYLPDIAYLSELIQKYPDKEFFYWSSKDKNADLFLSKSIIDGDQRLFEVVFNDQIYEFKLPFNDPASLHNAMNCLLFAFVHGIPADILGKQLQSLPVISMRMETRQGKNNNLLICDFYNADPGSLQTTLEYLPALRPNQPKTLILTDFDGFTDFHTYQNALNLILQQSFDHIFLLGPQWKQLSARLQQITFLKHFDQDADDLIKYLKTIRLSNQVILIKGSRKYTLEKVAAFFEPAIHSVQLEISMNDIAHNFHFFRKQIPSSTKIMAIIKAFGYGSGLKELSGYLQYLGCHYFAVAFTNEGVELREAGVNIPILVMNPEPETFPLLIQYNLTPSIFSFQQWKLFSRAVLDYGDRIPYPVHIKLDTGMNRLGFKPDEMEELLEIIKQDKYLFVEGIFSHLAASEDPEQDEFSLRQANVFVEMCREIEAQLDYRPIRHLLNSAGILRFPQFAMDMVRLGIGLHGFIGKSRHPQLKIPHRLTSRISQIKTVSKGESVGYGRMFRAERQHKIAILPIGYADGLRRQLSHGRWLVNVNGQYAPTVGWICMDMCMIDVSGIDCKEGDRVVIFSSENNLEKMSGICNTIPYELLTGLSHRIKRVFHEE